MVLLVSQAHVPLLEQFTTQWEEARMRISSSKSEAIVLRWKRVECLHWYGEEALSKVHVSEHLGVLVINRGIWSGRLIGGLELRLSDAGVVPVCRGEERAESKRDDSLDSRFYLQLWSPSLDCDRKNKIADISGQN